MALSPTAVHLDLEAREYITWIIDGAPADSSIEVQFRTETGETSWLAVERTSLTEVRILLAGPQAEPGAATVLASGRHASWLRLSDNPEIIPRYAGVIQVY
jgi:hypothetical protein